MLPLPCYIYQTDTRRASAYKVNSAEARKRPRPFCPKCRWQVTPKHAYTLDPTRSEWADCRCPCIVWEPLRKQLTRNLSGNVRPQSSQLAEPLLTGPGIKSGIGVRELISISEKKKKKKTQAVNGQIFSQKPRKRGRSHHHILYRNLGKTLQILSVFPAQLQIAEITVSRPTDTRSLLFSQTTTTRRYDQVATGRAGE